MRLFLELTFQDNKSSVLIDDDFITIGRSEKSTYPIPDPSLSSVHCKIYVKDNLLYVEDMNSKNGILLNGIKISKQKVYLNDIINIGDCLIKVDHSKLSEDALKILGPDIKAEDRSLVLELDTPQSNKKKQRLNSQNRKLYKGVPSLERTSKPTSKEEISFSKVIRFMIIIALIAFCYNLFR